MKKVTILLLAACSLFTFNSCTKTGPQGPQGPRGYDGNANVYGSNPFEVSNWSYNTSEVAYMASFDDDDITSAVADRGTVEMFLQYSDGSWRMLPDIVNGTQFYFRFGHGGQFLNGGFDIFFANVNGSTPAFPGTNFFRVVVISPSNRMAHPNTDWSNFDEAMAAINYDKAAAAKQ